MVPPTVGWFSHIINEIRVIPHRHAWRPISQVILDSVKLIINTNHLNSTPCQLDTSLLNHELSSLVPRDSWLCDTIRCIQPNLNVPIDFNNSNTLKVQCLLTLVTYKIKKKPHLLIYNGVNINIPNQVITKNGRIKTRPKPIRVNIKSCSSMSSIWSSW